ncbi:MAG: 3-hydroxybutyryl-CoA dehydrogenase [Dehalobacterium sp.]
MIIGAGQMGSGIAQVIAQAGYQVIVHDVNEQLVTKGIKSIDQNLDRMLTKGRITEETKTVVISQIKGSTDLSDASGMDLIIEAIIENKEIKGCLFKALDDICKPGTIFASNTSSFPITELATFTKRPEKFIGMHFMNPAPVMKLVEVIRGLATADEVSLAIKEFCVSIEKTAVEVNDFPGFVLNRILIPQINEAIFILNEGVAKPEAIDEIMKLGANYPMGPLALADLIGLDTCLAITETLFQGFGDSKYRPCPLLRKYVKAGYLGRKTGRGFYQYEKS